MSITQKVLIKDVLKDNSTKELKNIDFKQNQRNYGIDLLRMFSMINIINLHINLRGGLLRLKPNNVNYKEIWRLETFSYFPVDCFALISGIIGYNRYKFSNLIYLWFLTLFYSVSKHLYLYMQNRVKLKKLFFSFFPILIKFHWYVNAYFIMYLFLPFINFGIKSLNMKTFRNLVIFYVLFFSIYYIINALFIKSDYNFLAGGYTSSWLTILYIIGSYLGKYKLENIDKSSNKIKIFFFINYIGLSFLSSEIFFITRKSFLICYLSPTILSQAICLVIIFYTMKIKNKFIITIIKFITPLVFSATLIHSILFSFNLKIIVSLFDSLRELNITFIFLKIYTYYSQLFH